jgi:hypothetical protein
MRTLKERGGGLFQNIKGLFTRKKSKVTPVPQTQKAPTKNTLYQKLKGKVKGLNKPPTSAPTQYPLTKYPMFKGNERRGAVIDTMNLEATVARSVREKVPKQIDTETMGPPTKNTPTDRIQTLTLPIEDYRDGQTRMFLFFYNKMKETQGQPVSPNTLYASIEEIKELFHTLFLFKYKRFPHLIKDQYLKEEEYVDEFNGAVAREVFGTEVDELDTQIQEAERKNYALPSLRDPNQLQFGNQYGGYLARYLPIMTRPLRQFDYLADFAENDCRATIHGDERPPIDSFASPFCICCFLDSAHFERFREEIVKGCSNYIIFNFMYFPHAKDYMKKPMPVLLSASKFLGTSFVQDAFKEQGVTTMDEDLFKLLQKESPRLIESSKVFLATADKFKHLKLYDHFMILTEKALPEGLVVTYKDPLQIAALRRAFDEDREFLLADPYTAYCTKKKNMNLWSKAFGIKASPTKGVYWNSNFDSYVLLRDVEKLYVDFCQYQMVIGKYLDLTQNSTRTSVEESLKKASELYKLSIKDTKFLETLSSVASGEKIFDEFKKIQKTLITYDTPLQTVEDVRALITKLNPGWRRNRTLFEPAARQPQRGTLRLARVIPPLPESPRASFPSLPPSAPSTPRSNTASVNSNDSYVAIAEAMLPSSTIPTQQQIQGARQLIQQIDSELSRATPIYNTTRRKHGFRSNTSNNAITSKYTSIVKKPRATWSRTEADFMKNYARILRNFSSHRNILLHTRQQQVDLLRRLEATSV